MKEQSSEKGITDIVSLVSALVLTYDDVMSSTAFHWVKSFFLYIHKMEKKNHSLYRIPVLEKNKIFTYQIHF